MCLVSKGSVFGMSQILGVQKNIIKIKKDKGGDRMEKQINSARYHGFELQQTYFRKGKDKKVETIIYKSLSALKIKNSSRFADVLLNAYMTVNMPVPYVFVNALKSEDELCALGYAFVLGLKGEGKSNDETANKTTTEGEED
jgi:CRISPR-associated protein Cst1